VAYEMVRSEVGASAEVFNNNIVKVAPPGSDTEAMETIYAMLSADAKSKIDEAPSVSFGLAVFAGVQDVPDKAIEIVGISINNDEAEVVKNWVYSGMIGVRTYTFIKESGEWKLDSIR
jgi:hypothetical protein